MGMLDFMTSSQYNSVSPLFLCTMLKAGFWLPVLHYTVFSLHKWEKLSLPHITTTYTSSNSINSCTERIHKCQKNAVQQSYHFSNILQCIKAEAGHCKTAVDKSKEHSTVQLLHQTTKIPKAYHLCRLAQHAALYTICNLQNLFCESLTFQLSRVYFL